MIGVKIKRKITIHGMYVFIISFEILNLIKNNTVKVKTRKIPSALTIVVNDASINDNIIHFLSYFKKITSADICSKINNDSCMPNNEFNIIRGSKINNDTPINAIFLSKNFLHKK